MSIKVTVGNGTFFSLGKGFGRISTRKSGLKKDRPYLFFDGKVSIEIQLSCMLELAHCH
ncbi:MAG: hypothetical protein OXC03_06370 [Flavobacteriaceae bacterium]|nr:hypothetical protein [Flavobacteriaceae bacterium]